MNGALSAYLKQQFVCAYVLEHERRRKRQVGRSAYTEVAGRVAYDNISSRYRL